MYARHCELKDRSRNIEIMKFVEHREFYNNSLWENQNKMLDSWTCMVLFLNTTKTVLLNKLALPK